jgi:tellurite methyltransferase
MMNGKNRWDERYTAEGYFWDKVPLPICQKLIEIVKPSASYRPKLIDLGCGEGRNVVFLAKNGFDATGVDISAAGLKKTVQYASEVGVQVETVQADLSQYQLQDSYDVVFSTVTLQYLPADMREQCFAHYKEHTQKSGINLISVQVEKPFLPSEPNDDPTRKAYRSGQLAGYYWDWELLSCVEDIKEAKGAGGRKRAINTIIARKRV